MERYLEVPFTKEAAQLKAGAEYGATGENPAIVNSRDADIIIGPIGIVIADSLMGEITPAMAAAIGASKNAKRAAMIHLYFNLIGTMLFMAVFYAINAAVHFSFMEQAATPAGIAILHSTFNITATLVLLPFGKALEKLACLTIRDRKEEEEKVAALRAISQRFLPQHMDAFEDAIRRSLHRTSVVRITLTSAPTGKRKQYDKDGEEMKALSSPNDSSIDTVR